MSTVEREIDALERRPPVEPVEERRLVLAAKQGDAAAKGKLTVGAP